MAGFEELLVWKRSRQLTVLVYKVLSGCRDRSVYDQITRAAVSISSNMAEGAERQTRKEFIHFLYIAKGSAAELRTQLYWAHQLNIGSKQEIFPLIQEVKEISNMLQGLISNLKIAKPVK